MVPLTALTTVEHRLGPEFMMRYNLSRQCANQWFSRSRIQFRPGNTGPGGRFR